MSLASILKIIPLLTPAVDAVKSWLAPSRPEAKEPGDASAQRQGAAAGEAARRASREAGPKK